MRPFIPFPPSYNPDAKPVTIQLSDQEKYDAIERHFLVPDFQVKGEKDEETSPLTEEEKFWLSKECILRYLRATKWDTSEAIKRLELTLSWRRSYGFYRPSFATDVEPEGVTGKCHPLGFDVAGRPCMYLVPSRQNTEPSDTQTAFTFYMFEKTIDMMGPGVETLALLINFGDRGKIPPMSQAKNVLYILQTHYPERLGKAFIVKIPILVNGFLRITMAFVDPVTRAKIHLNPDVAQDNLVSRDMLVTTWGGDIDHTYDHDKYWPEFLRLANEAKEANMRRWRALGAKVGISEWDYKGGNATGVQGVTEKIPVLDMPMETSASELIEVAA